MPIVACGACACVRGWNRCTVVVHHQLHTKSAWRLSSTSLCNANLVLHKGITSLLSKEIHDR